MVSFSKILIGIVLLIAAYYVGVAGSFGEKSQYQWTDGLQGPGIYKVTYSYNYPWLGIVFTVCGITIAAAGMLERNKIKRKTAEILMKKEEENCPDGPDNPSDSISA